MKHVLPTVAPARRAAAAALAVSALALWRMPSFLGVPEGGSLPALWAMGFALGAALFLLLRHAFACGDGRLKRNAFLLGLLFACLTWAGRELNAKGGFTPLTWAVALDGLLTLALFAPVYGSGLLLLYQGAERLARRPAPEKPESLFSRLLGNGFVVFPLLLLCWIPVWLAFWPGTFGLDAATQFYTYLDGAHSTHHPLLHTLFLGACMTLGIDMDPEGYATLGIAAYSLAQMVLLAAMLAYGCSWLRRMGAPLWARLGATLLFGLFPFYPLWSFCAHKDVLFSGLVMLLALELADLWREGFAALRSPLRVLRFGLIAVLMMLLRHNGLYALCLLLPFALLWAKGARGRVALLLLGCVAGYLLGTGALVWATEAEGGSQVEMLSIPLQQMARTLREDPEALAEEDRELLDAIYGDGYVEYYEPQVADPVKWAIDSEAAEERLPELLSLWARLGVGHGKAYWEAFLLQNLPYLLPGAQMLYRFDLGIAPIDLYPVQEHSYLPALRALYEAYDKTLSFLGLPGVHLLSDTAFYVWACLAGLGLAQYRRQRHWMVAFALLLGVWVTCLLGPVALMRYMLGFFYAMPLLLAAMLTPGKHPVPLADRPLQSQGGLS